MAAATAKIERAKTAVDTAQKDLTAAEVAAKATADKAAAERTAAWGTWIQKGIINNGSTDAKAAFSWDKIAGAWASRNTPADSGFELNFISDYSVGDGRFANNSWLQEMPEPITKITWDNAASISKGTARELNINTGDLVKITSGGASLEIAACVTHGVAEGSIILPLGYGRTHGGKFATGAGFNAYSLMNGPDWIQSGATLAKSMGSYQLAITQMEKGDFSGEIQTRIDGLVRENTVDEYKKEKDFVKKYEVMPKDKLKSLFDVPDNSEGEQWNSVGQQWGMTIDLSSCNGCNSCAIACQAENNVAVVGKKEVANGREMHWLRMDRYFDGTDENPDSAIQPMSCSHCENAPCETVCPVAATAHGPEGTNDIAYNRCIGTRYCANNCPYKVRRFNYYNFSKRMDEDYGPLIAMQRNPDVTVRFRGVIEKCSYCVQRITEAHIEAKTTGDRTGTVPTVEFRLHVVKHVQLEPLPSVT
jgi:molybdopterin-containing oxidoreductase family iron-sulfur binding subunit